MTNSKPLLTLLPFLNIRFNHINCTSNIRFQSIQLAAKQIFSASVGAGTKQVVDEKQPAKYTLKAKDLT